MPPQIALLLGLAFSFWLFRRDVGQREGVSKAVWIPLIWLFIVSSKPVCLWLGFGMGSGQAYDEGTPLDRLFYLALIIAGLRILSRRRSYLSEIVAANQWLCIFFAYWAISIMWSDFPFISFKRWIKDVGNLVMVLVILSETKPVEAAKAVFLRCAYILIPLSVVYIKYFPDSGRTYNPWTWTYMYVGATQHKNALGSLVLVSSLFMAWDFFLGEGSRFKERDWKDKASRAILALMCAWLLHMANSATSLLCLVLAMALLLGFKLRAFKRNAHTFATIFICTVVVLTALDSALGLREMIITGVGRDMTLTTRTGLWDLVLKQDFNPLIGTGFYSFWLGQRLAAIWQVYEGLTQSHNGYIETYLNGGIIGVCLLAAWLVTSYWRIRGELRAGRDFARLQFAFFVVLVIYNFTEATFNRLSSLWLVALLITVRYPGHRLAARSASVTAETVRPVRQLQPVMSQ